MQYLSLAALYGALLSVMNTANARLSLVYGNWGATVMIHLVGLIVLLPVAFSWGRPRAKSPALYHTGGLIGILSVVFVNVGIAGLGVTANLVLMLLGQVAASAAVDHLGLFGVRVHRVNGAKLVAMAVMAAGCGAMLLLSGETVGGGGGTAVAALLSLLSGGTMIAARFANAMLSERSGVGYSTVMNYVTGLIGSFLVFAAMGLRLETPFPATGESLLIYTGGALGALGIFLANVVTPRLPALQMSVVVFVGQVFTGMVIDGLMGRFSAGTLVGGVVVAAGLLLNIRADGRGDHGANHQPEES